MLKGYGLKSNDFDITFDSDGTDDQIDTPTALESIGSPRGNKQQREAVSWKSLFNVMDDGLFQKKRSKQIINKVHRTEQMPTKFPQKKSGKYNGIRR